MAPAFQAAQAAATCPACATGLKGGLLYAGSSGDSRLAFDPHKLQIQPRAGVAYRVTSKLVFRGGYGLSYLGAHPNGQEPRFIQTTPLVASLANGSTHPASCRHPLP